jgi:hypothetical protein
VWALCPLALVVAAHAQEAGPEDWSLEVGASRVVEVGPYTRFVVLDPERLSVEEATGESIRVTALQRTGIGVVHVFGEDGGRTLAFDVCLPSPGARASLDERRELGGPTEDIRLTSRASASGRAIRTIGSLSQDLSYTQEFDDAFLTGRLGWAVQDNGTWSVPTVRLEARLNPLGFGLGDTSIAELSLPGPAIRGVWAEWGAVGVQGPVLGAVAGFHRPVGRCCVLADPSEGGIVAFRGGYDWGRASTSAVIGVLDDREGGGTSPVVRFAATYRDDHIWGSAEVARSGSSYGLTSRFTAEEGLFRLVTTTRFLQRGYFYAPGAAQLDDRLLVVMSPEVLIGTRGRVRADVSWSSMRGAEPPAQHIAAISTSARVAAGGGHGVGLGLSRSQRVLAANSAPDAERAYHGAFATHSYYRSHRARLVDRLELAARDRLRFHSLTLHHRSLFFTETQMQWGFDGTLRLGEALEQGSLHLAGRIGREGAHLDAFALVGGHLIAGHGATRLSPTLGGSLVWVPNPHHLLEVTVGTGGSTRGTLPWSITAEYTLSWSNRRNRSTPLAFRGRIDGQVFFDRNLDGVVDDGEAGVEGLLVTLDGTETAHTDASGKFGFRGVLVGPHQVTVTTDGWFPSMSNRIDVEVEPQRTASVVFPVTPNGVIEVRSFLDLDDDSTFTEADRLMPPSRITVTRVDDTMVSHGRLLGDHVEVGHLPAGEYVVTLDPIDLLPGLTPIDNGREVTLEADERIRLDFPLLAERAVGGTVYADERADGRLTTRDPPAANVLVNLSPDRVTRTDAEGRFLFRRVGPGEHDLRIEGAEPVRIFLGEMPEDVLYLEFLVPVESLPSPAPDDAE